MFKLIAVPEDSMMLFGDSIINQTFTYDTANANGYFEIPVYANENLTGADSSYYRVRFQDQYGNYIDKYAWNVYIPDTSAIKFDSLKRWR
jgi:hypothetical protein